MNRALSYLVAARRSEVSELEKLSRNCELVLAMSELVHCLQQERGASNMFLASAGMRFSSPRQERIITSDKALAKVDSWFDQVEDQAISQENARLLIRTAIALQSLDGLASIRADIGKLACTPQICTERFNQLIGSLLSLVFESADVAVDPAITHLLIALFHLMQGKEFAGQERATGATAFALGEISASQVASIEYLIEMQEQSLQKFEAFAEELMPEWKALQATLPLLQLERMRRVLLTGQVRKLDREQTDVWFECCSRRMDELHRVETHLAEHMQMLCKNKVAEKLQELEDQEKLIASLANPSVLSPQTALAVQTNLEGKTGLIGPHLTQSVIDLLQSQSLRLQEMTEQLAAARASLDERKLIERAKGVLMIKQGISEEEAYRLLRHNAMNQNCRIIDIAQSIMALTGLFSNAK